MVTSLFQWLSADPAVDMGRVGCRYRPPSRATGDLAVAQAAASVQSVSFQAGTRRDGQAAIIPPNHAIRLDTVWAKQEDLIGAVGEGEAPIDVLYWRTAIDGAICVAAYDQIGARRQP